MVREEGNFLKIEKILRSQINCFLTRWGSTMGYHHREWYEFDVKFNGARPVEITPQPQG